MGWKLPAVAAVSAACLIAATNAEAAGAPTPRDLARIVRLADPHFSPDGKTIAVVESRADLESDEFRSEILLDRKSVV